MVKKTLNTICVRAQQTWTSVVPAAVALACALGAVAAEPLCWERTPNRPAPAQFDTFHGESLDFRCTFTGFGALPFPEGADDVRLWYQTNGMGAAWWSIPATVSSNVLAATFPPSADPGAERLTVFFGAPSNAYSAAQVRFRNSPGAFPNNLQPPSVLDWQAELAAATNALWESSAAAFMPQSNAYTKAETDARIAELAPRTSLEPATNYTDTAIQGLAGQYLATTGGVVEGTTKFNTLHVDNGLTIEGNLISGSAVSAVEGYFENAYINGTLTVNNEQIDPHTLITTYNIGEYVPQPDLSEYATKSALAAVSNEAQVVYRLYTASNELPFSVSTNNPAFVAAVTNCPVAIAASDAEALTEWGIYGGGGTIGALLAALAAAVAALKRGKVTTISAQSTDEQYPSAKCVWDIVGNVESALAAINGTSNGGSGT